MAKIDNAKMDVIKLIRDHGKGALALELSQKLQEVALAVKTSGKKGTLTLKMDIVPAPNIPGAAVMLKPDVKAMLPQVSPKAAVMYITDDGVLQRDDPNQRDFQEVEKSFREESR